jgi:hypothetical protein
MKFRTKLTLAALAALALIVAAACSQTPSVDHYPTFVQAMDQLVGPGKWSAKSHVNGQDDLLTVSGVTIKLPGLATSPAVDSNAPPELIGSDGTVETGPDKIDRPVVTQDQVVEIATVEVKKPLDKKTLETLIATADWKNQKETKLADSVVLKGISYKAPQGTIFPNYSVEEAAVKSVLLSAAGAEAPTGRAGFLKALRLADFSYKNFKMEQKSPEAEMQLVVGTAAVQGVAFDGEMFAAFDSLDPSGLTSVMTAMSAKSASVKNIVMDMKEPGDKFTGKMTVASVEEKDIKAMGAFGDLTMDGFKFDIVDEKKRPSTISLAKMNMRGFDMTAYMNRMAPVMVAASLNPGQAEQLVSGLYTLGDIFVSPFSLDEVSLSGLDLNIADGLMIIKMAEAKASGPYIAGQLPVTQKSSLSGLEIILPEDAAKAAQDSDFKELYDFGQQFGMTRFLIESEGNGSYDAASGKVVSRLTRLTVKDLLEISGSGEMGGLTTERLEKLKSVPMTMAMMALMAPDEIFGEAAFHNLSVKVADKGLTERLLNLTAAKISEDGGSKVKVNAEGVRQIMISNLPDEINKKGGEYLANPEVLTQALIAFITKPGSLELKMAAQPPVGVKSVIEMGLDANQILNSMNISISANDQEAPPLKFAISN